MGQEWVLSGREIFVLAAGTTHRGFVSSPRLKLGQEHAVLCTTSVFAAVENALHKAGCTNWTKYGEDDGAPTGWIVVVGTDRAGRPRGIIPTNDVPMEESSDILNVLCPVPDIEISLEGGVPLGHSSWLAGYAPAIRIIGDAQNARNVLIDGKEAAIGDDGTCRAQGWDEPGSHQVWCSETSRSYSLIRSEPTWDAWPAHVFASSGSDRVAICGPLVRALTTDGILRKGTNVLRRNSTLLGAVPGQVFVAVPRPDLRGAYCFASPPFDPVWAIPAEPLRCDKTAHRILLVGNVGAPRSRAGPTSTGNAATLQWCRLILDASRKGLSVEPAAAGDLWRSYKRFARTLCRRTR
jgi:hypothetical protein